MSTIITTHEDGTVILPDDPALRAKALHEIKNRPRVLPLNRRHYWTPEELEKLRNLSPEERRKFMKRSGY